MREQAVLDAELEFGRWMREAVEAVRARAAAEQLGEAFLDLVPRADDLNERLAA